MQLESLHKEHKPYGLKENIKIAKMGGNVAKVARDNLEEKLGKTVIIRNNALKYEYLDDNKLDKSKQITKKSTKKLKEKNNTNEQ